MAQLNGSANGSAKMPRRSRFNRGPRVMMALKEKREPKPANLDELVERFRSDPDFKLGVAVIRSLVQSAGVSVEFEGDIYDEDDATLDIVQTDLVDAWKRSIRDASQVCEYGRCAFEKVISLNHETKVYGVSYLSYLPFKWTDLVFDDTGAIKYIRFGDYEKEDAKEGEDYVDLPPTQAWWITYDAEITNPWGRSIYKGAPEKVLEDRVKHEKNSDNFYRRYSVGLSVGKAPAKHEIEGEADYEGEPETDQSGEIVDPMAEMVSALEAAENGGVIVVRSGNYPPDSEGFGAPMYEFSDEADVKDASGMENRQRILDAKAYRSIGVPERSITQDGETGSRAVAGVHLQVLWDAAGFVLSEIAKSFNTSIAKHVAWLNWGGRIKARLVISAIGDTTETDNRALGRAIASSPQVSPLVTEEVIDAAALLEKAGVPVGSNPRDGIARIRESMRQSAQVSAQFATGRKPVKPLTPDEIQEATVEAMQAKKAEIVALLDNPVAYDRGRL